MKIKQFKKWIESEGIATFEELQNLVVLEEFLRRIPANIAMFIRERQEKDGQKAAILADEYNLIHKTKKFSPPEQISPGVSCAFCKQKVHLIKDCPSPKCQVAKSSGASPSSQNSKQESSKNPTQNNSFLFSTHG